MKDLYIIYFSKNGEISASRIAETLASDSQFTLHKIHGSPIAENMKAVFKRENILVFIGAVGIAVRAVSTLLQSKATDPPVIVIDEKANFVIPILSGHIGGANRLAERIAASIGATAIITTATDSCGVFAVDSFAVENGYAIINPAAIKIVSSMLLRNETVFLSSEFEIQGTLPENIVLKERVDVGIHIGKSYENVSGQTLLLLPKRFHIGIGCKRDISFELLDDFFRETLENCSISVETVATISSIDLKRNEEAINMLSKRYHVPFRTYTVEELRKHEHGFESSQFVRDKIGVGNVCEASAWMSSNRGSVILAKQVRNGMTIAIAEENWIVRF